MSSIAMKRITPTSPQEKCNICACTAEEKPTKVWGGHSLSEKIIENGKEVEKLKWAHHFHKKCLVKTVESGYQFCPGACGNIMDLSPLFSRTERAIAASKVFFKNAAVGTIAIAGGILAAAPIAVRTGSIEHGLINAIVGSVTINVSAEVTRIAGLGPKSLIAMIIAAPTLVGIFSENLEGGILMAIAAITILGTQIAAFAAQESLGADKRVLGITSATLPVIMAITTLMLMLVNKLERPLEFNSFDTLDFLTLGSLGMYTAILAAIIQRNL
jgi:hypothetical protein